MASDGITPKSWTTFFESFIHISLTNITDVDDFGAILPHLKPIKDDIVLADKLEPIAKSAEKFGYHKANGNAAFEKRSYKEAIQHYNACILHAVSNADTAIALNNRAAAFFYDEQYFLAALDSAEALKQGYPAEKAAKLRERIALSLEQLKIKRDPGESIEDLIQNLVSLQIKDASKSHGNVSRKFSENIFVHNPEYYGLTSSADVKVSTKAGRYVQAISDIDVGDIVINEHPFVAIMNRPLYTQFCHHCYRSVVSAVPCSNCSGVAFCSSVCHSAAESYHSTECMLLGSIEKEVFFTFGQKACRFVTRIPLNEFMEETKDVFVPGSSEDSLYGRVLSSERHPELITPETCFRFTWVTLYLIDALKRVGYFENGADTGTVLDLSDTELHVAKCIYRFLHLSEYNSASVNRLNLESSAYRYENIGTGVYPSTNNINHDCNANTFGVNVHDGLILVANRPIKAGEEITLSYGPTFMNRSSVERQKFLQKKFGFKCTCECCTTYAGMSHQDLNSIPFNGFDRFWCPLCDVIVKTGERCKSCSMPLPGQEQLASVYAAKLRIFENLKQDEENGHKRMEQVPYMEDIIRFLVGIWGDVGVEVMNALSLYSHMLRYLAAQTER